MCSRNIWIVPKSRKMGSIAGVVASLNDSLSRYFSTVAIQKQGQEIIDALKIAFMQSLIRYELHLFLLS